MKIYKEKRIYENETIVRIVFFLDTSNYWCIPTIGIKKLFYETSMVISILCVRIFIEKEKLPF